MRVLLVSIFLISIIFFISIPDAFGKTYLVNVPMGAAGGVGNFEPNVITIEKGDTIKWSIFDRGKHSVTSNSGLFDNSPMEANRAGSTCFPDCKPFTYTFHDDGTYDYHCKFHSWMQGSVIVGGLGTTAVAKDCTNVGCVYLDKQRYEVSEGRTVLVKIYGKINDSKNNDFVFLTIKEPSGKIGEHKIPVTSTGKFVYPLPINYDKRGMYDVIVRGGYNPNGSQLGSVWFEVVKTSAISPQKEITPTSIILKTDLQRYEKGSIIGIAGQLVPYQSGQSDVTVKVYTPNGNITHIDQIQPSSTGMFGSTVNTRNWTEYGNYEIKAQFENLVKSTSFAFTIPIPSSTSKTSTFLKLDSIDNTFNIQGQNSEADVIITGQLLEADRKSPIPFTKIKLVTNGFSLADDTLTTDDNGKFAVKVAMGNNFVGQQLSIQTVYDGSSNFKSSQSQIEYFDVRTSSQSQSTQSEDSSAAGGVVFLLVIIMIVVIVAIAIKKRKKKPLVTVPPPSGRGTAGTATIAKAFISRKIPRTGKAPLLMGKIRQAKRAVGKQSPKARKKKDVMHYLRCKQCHLEEFLENEADGQQYCTKCGWKKR
jgi:plastocyanin